MSFFSRVKDAVLGIFGLSGPSEPPPPRTPPPEPPEPPEPEPPGPGPIGPGGGGGLGIFDDDDDDFGLGGGGEAPPEPPEPPGDDDVDDGPVIPPGFTLHLGYDDLGGRTGEQQMPLEDLNPELLALQIRQDAPQRAWLWIENNETGCGVGSTWINPQEFSLEDIEDWITATRDEALDDEGS